MFTTENKYPQCNTNDLMQISHRKSLIIGRTPRAILGMFGMLNQKLPFKYMVSQNLDKSDIAPEYRNNKILDISSGFSSFTRGYNFLYPMKASAVDPLYCGGYVTPKLINDGVTIGTSSISKMLLNPRYTYLFDRNFFNSTSVYLDSLKASADGFYYDYLSNEGSYFCGALPSSLPFTGNNKFDLCLIGHFLFFRGELPEDMVLSSILSLLSICKEVRISPVITYNGTSPAYLNSITHELSMRNYSISYIDTQYREYAEGNVFIKIHGGGSCKINSFVIDNHLGNERTCNANNILEYGLQSISTGLIFGVIDYLVNILFSNATRGRLFKLIMNVGIAVFLTGGCLVTAVGIILPELMQLFLGKYEFYGSVIIPLTFVMTLGFNFIKNGDIYSLGQMLISALISSFVRKFTYNSLNKYIGHNKISTNVDFNFSLFNSAKEKFYLHSFKISMFLLLLPISAYSQLTWYDKQIEIGKSGENASTFDYIELAFLWGLPKMAPKIRGFLLKNFISDVAGCYFSKINHLFIWHPEFFIRSGGENDDLITQKIYDISSRFLSDVFVTILPEIIDLALGYYKISYVFPRILLPAFLANLMYFFIDFYGKKIIQKHQKKCQESYNRYIGAVNNTRNNTRTILFNHLESPQEKIIKDELKSYIANDNTKNNIETIMSISKNSILVLFYIFILYDQRISTQLFLMIGLLNYIVWPMNRLAESTTSAMSLFSEIRKHECELKRTFSRLPSPSVSADTDFKLLQLASIVFQNVSYAVAGKCIFDCASFIIKPGSKILLTGENGTGKSTLIDLLESIIEPTSGEIFLLLPDHTKLPCNLENKSIFRKFYSIVEQNPRMLNGGRDLNLTTGKKINSDVKRPLPFHDVAGTMPDHSRGDLFSGGEAQKAAILRAFSNVDAGCFILDEATSALDIKAKKEFNSFVFTLTDKIIIRITHHTSEIEEYKKQGYQEISLPIKGQIEIISKKHHKIAKKVSPDGKGHSMFFSSTAEAVKTESRFNDDTRRAALYTQRIIDKVMLDGGRDKSSMTVEVTPDGNCGFTATEQVLRIDGKDRLAVATTRIGFIYTVKRAILELRNPSIVVDRREKLTHLVKAIYEHARIDEFDLSIDKLSEWEAHFNSSSEWANDVHFSLMSYIHNIRFEFYVVDHEHNDRFVPRGGSLGEGSIIYEGGAEEPIFTVRLLSNTADTVNLAAADPNNHFDLLYFEPNDALKDRIRELGYKITQDDLVAPVAAPVGPRR